jgi:hypothetical protein
MKLGRQARRFDPRVPHLSARLAAVNLPPPPPSIDYTVGLPASLGVMGNDSLGDCTCAAYYHARQVWSFTATGVIDTEPDSDVLALYEGACGYVPGNSASDQGGIEQVVLSYLIKTGASNDDGPENKLLAFVEVDPRNVNDVKNTIVNCGVCYIGFDVPKYMMDGLTAAGSTWDVNPNADNTIVGGHAVVVAGYDDNGVRVISWGDYFTMTWAFFAQHVDEAYALCDPVWIRATGLTPANMTVAQLEDLMQAIKHAN